jgi:hypothetical protein
MDELGDFISNYFKEGNDKKFHYQRKGGKKKSTKHLKE